MYNINMKKLNNNLITNILLLSISILLLSITIILGVNLNIDTYTVDKYWANGSSSQPGSGDAYCVIGNEDLGYYFIPSSHDQTNTWISVDFCSREEKPSHWTFQETLYNIEKWW